MSRNYPIPPAVLSEAQIEQKYREVFADKPVYGYPTEFARLFVEEVARQLPDQQGEGLRNNFGAFLQSSPSDEAIYQNTFILLQKIASIGGEDVIRRHEARVVSYAYGAFIAQVNDGNAPKKPIVFVTHKPYFTILRQALYLKKNGYRVFLVSLQPIPETLQDTFAKAFDAIVHTSANAKLLAGLVAQLKPQIYHVQCWMFSYWLGKLVIENAGAAKVVCEFYDVFSLIAPRDVCTRAWAADKVDFDLAMEKFIGQNANAVITRFPEPVFDTLKKNWGGKPNIRRFWPYPCREYSHFSAEKWSHSDGIIRVVFPGNVVPFGDEHPLGLLPQVGLLDICRKLLEQGLYVDLLQDPHIPIDLSLPGFAPYQQLLDQYPGFKIMPGIAPDKLAQRISHYDFGLMVFRHEEEEGWSYPDLCKYGVGTRFFPYMEAGLPIIFSARYEYMADLIRKNYLGITVDWEDIDQTRSKIEAFDYQKSVANIMKYNEDYGMEKQISKLIEIYNSL